MKKTILITGANSGFGYLTALKFARNGYKVYATTRDMSKEGVTSLLDIAKKETLDIEWLVLDVTKNETITQAKEKINHLDVLVNNAGYGMFGLIEDMSEEDIKMQFDTNFFGVFRMIKAFLPIMKEEKESYIINVSSVAGISTFAKYGAYSSSKFAIEALTTALRLEVSKYNIRVAMVEPGSFKTNFGDNVKYIGEDITKGKNSIFIRLQKKISKSFSHPEHVANRIYKLCQKNNPPLQNFIGIDSKLVAFFKKILPLWFWNSLSKSINK
ncbi:SDR family oxidoreductase [Candidatus Dojkabacteria bacterium]|jgi:NAD(P)-dependent dehydrogenase (short-subunit alcohol dehydrogenase family)|nr:SDR family oxidoreductase [Candidatus Dojkabacteria bacterium]